MQQLNNLIKFIFKKRTVFYLSLLFSLVAHADLELMCRAIKPNLVERAEGGKKLRDYVDSCLPNKKTF